ncbi:MAG: translation initiation factor IF-2, partial [Chloroflexi bacterium]|nr:translation initiation factor IF-2 [Chloroflexota bacterium]
ADDGVQPQTREAIDHARAAQVPIIVAINKIDLPTANQENVKQQLAELGLVPEDWGGETIFVPVSARTKQGIDSLLDMILLVAEMADLKANPRANAEGAVVEGKLDRSRGPIATLLVEEGVLKPGDTILVGETYGKLRAMFDQRGKPLKRAAPSTPVVVMGLDSVPKAGDRFRRVESEKEAREAVDKARAERAEVQAQPSGPLTLEEVYAQAQAGQVQTLNLVLKVDVQGSLEPIHNSLDKIDVSGLKVRFIHEGVGAIGESDVMLALASNAIIVGFSVDVDPAISHMPEATRVSIRTYDIIYRLIEDIQLALQGMLAPEYRDVVVGRAVVRTTFRVPKIGQIAGAQVTEGKALRSAAARVVRGDATVFEGQVASLKRFTEDVREVANGMECGIGLDGFGDFQPDDVIEFLTKERVR